MVYGNPSTHDILSTAVSLVSVLPTHLLESLSVA